MSWISPQWEQNANITVQPSANWSPSFHTCLTNLHLSREMAKECFDAVLSLPNKLSTISFLSISELGAAGLSTRSHLIIFLCLTFIGVVVYLKYLIQFPIDHKNPCVRKCTIIYLTFESERETIQITSIRDTRECFAKDEISTLYLFFLQDIPCWYVHNVNRQYHSSGVYL